MMQEMIKIIMKLVINFHLQAARQLRHMRHMTKLSGIAPPSPCQAAGVVVDQLWKVAAVCSCYWAMIIVYKAFCQSQEECDDGW